MQEYLAQILIGLGVVGLIVVLTQHILTLRELNKWKRVVTHISEQIDEALARRDTPDE